jgi:biotin synthesis protein BioG
MKSIFLKQSDNKKLILFFNGWGMDASIVNHLASDDSDVCMFFDYDGDFKIENALYDFYQEIHLIAWSMGVWAAEQALKNSALKVNHSIAINGTLKPIDDVFGIPKAIFKGTIDQFSERNLKKFQRRMFLNKTDYDWFSERRGERELVDQLKELKSIYKAYKDEANIFTFAKVIIGQNDLIFPYQNQLNFWKNHSNVEILEMAHFPFHTFKTWTQLLNA